MSGIVGGVIVDQHSPRGLHHADIPARAGRDGDGKVTAFQGNRSDGGDPFRAVDHFNEAGFYIVNSGGLFAVARLEGAEILLAERNFGCGSSREHAAWALNQFGFRAVIAPTFADIFYSNAGKNGIILCRLTDAEVETLIQRSTANPQHQITINLEQQTVTDDQGFQAHFDIDPFRKHCLLNGLDDIGLTLLHKDKLDAYEAKHNEEFWLAPKAQATA